MIFHLLRLHRYHCTNATFVYASISVLFILLLFVMIFHCPPVCGQHTLPVLVLAEGAL